MEKENDTSAANGTQDADHQDETDPMVNMDECDTAKVKLNADGDSVNKIKFTTVNMMDGKNGEAKVDIHLVHTSIGMGKEELMKYANEPFWVRLRMFLFVLFWLGWIAMLVGAVVIILVAPRCPPPPKLDWYQKSAMYQVPVEHFKDSNGDGSGDLKGLLSKLDYFTSINVKTLILSGFYAIGQGGVVNHTEIGNKYGTMTDFEMLVKEVKNQDMKIILEFIPNHSSIDHPWFKASVKGEEPYTDYYVWAVDDKNGGQNVPNNWLTVGHGSASAWEWNEERAQYYLHTYRKTSPDLNLRNKHVMEELRQILKFWLDKGVDGFNIVGASHLLEDMGLRDEPLSTETKVLRPQYGDLDHIYTVNLPDNVELFAEWRELLDNYTESSGVRKIFMAEMSPGQINASVEYYGNSSNPLIDFPLSTDLTKLDNKTTAHELKDYLESWFNSTPSYMWPGLLVANELPNRLVDRVGTELLDGMHMVIGLARGTPITYFGDEIAMKKMDIPGLSASFPVGRMMWDREALSNYTEKLSGGQTAPPEYLTVNVQDEQKDKQSHLNIFSKIMGLRNQPAINFGAQLYPFVTDHIFSMMRIRKGSPGYLIAVNMGGSPVDINFKNDHLPETGHVEIRSRNLNSGVLAEGEHPKVKLGDISLGPYQAVVLSFVPQFSD